MKNPILKIVGAILLLFLLAVIFTGGSLGGLIVDPETANKVYDSSLLVLSVVAVGALALLAFPAIKVISVVVAVVVLIVSISRLFNKYNKPKPANIALGKNVALSITKRS